MRGKARKEREVEEMEKGGTGRRREDKQREEGRQREEEGRENQSKEDEERNNGK